MFQSLFGAKSIEVEQEESQDKQETFSRQVRIVVTNRSNDKGEHWGTNGTSMADNNNNNDDVPADADFTSRTQSVEVQPKPRGGLFSLFSSKKLVEKEDFISIEEADDGSVEAGLERRGTNKYDTVEEVIDSKYDSNKYDTVEVQNKPKGGLFGFLSSKKLVEKEDLISVEEADDGSVEAGLEADKKKYDVNALRVPAVLDQEEGPGNVVLDDEDEILKDPYSEIGPMDEPMMKDEEEDMNEEEEKDERKRFLMGLTSKLFFLLGSMLFLILAVHDYQRIKGSQPPVASRDQPTSAPDVPASSESPGTPAPNEDSDPFVSATVNSTGVADFEEELAIEDAQREERAGSLHVWSTDGTRRTQVTNWYTEYWSALPDDVKEAADLLGYDEETWDEGDSVYTDRLHWDKLTPAQKDAAFLVFGYTEDTWNDYVDRFLDNLPATEVNPSEPEPEPEPVAEPEPVTAPTAKPTNKPTPRPIPNEDSSGGAGADTEANNNGDSEPNEGLGEEFWSNESEGNSETTETNQDTDQERPAGNEGLGTEAQDGDGGSNSNGESMGGVGGSAQQTHETETGDRGDGGETGDQASYEDGNPFLVNATFNTDAEDEDEDPFIITAAFEEGYNINIEGEYPTEPRGKTFKIFYVFAAVCFVVVGALDAFHQQLGFHFVMVLAGVSGIMAGAFSVDNDKAFNICHSIASHLFFLQGVLIIYSRLLLTYDNSVRRVLNFADLLFAGGALMNVVVSYMQYDETTLAMTKTSLAAFSFWCVAALIYVAITIMFWLQRKRRTPQTGTTSGEASLQEESYVVDNGGGGCEISLQEGEAERDLRTARSF